MYYRECPWCGCNLDPGEICECRDESIKRMRKRQEDNRRMIEMLNDNDCIQLELQLSS